MDGVVKKDIATPKNKNNRAKEKCLTHKKGRQIGALFYVKYFLIKKLLSVVAINFCSNYFRHILLLLVSVYRQNLVVHTLHRLK